jgi:hypothetical protein
MKPRRDINFPARRLITRAAQLLCAVFLVGWLAWLAQFAGVRAGDTDAPSTDFVVYWLASDLVLSGSPELVYDAKALNAGRDGVAGEANDAWLYPPPALLLVAPLALLPLAVAFGAWVLATGSLLLTAVRRLWPDATVFWLALAFPATLFNAMSGQSGLLTAALFAWGMLLLRTQPVVAGAVLGLLAFKPHFLPLVMVALLVSGRRQALVACLGSGLAFAAVSLAVMASGTWQAFFEGVPGTASLVYDGVSPLEKMQSVTAMLLLAGSGATVAQTGQALASLAALAYVVWLWRRHAAFEFRVTGLGLAMLLATPYVYHYDLTILGVAMLFYAVRAHARGWRRWDQQALALAWFAPLAGFIVGGVASVIIGPFVFVALAALVALRMREEATVAREQPSPLLAAA